MKNKKLSPKKVELFFVSLIILFVIIAGVTALIKTSGLAFFTDASKDLVAVKVATMTSAAKCVDYDYSSNVVANSTPLPLVKGYTYDTLSNRTFNPAVIPNPQIEANADYCTLKGIRTSSCSGVGCGLMERYCANNRRSSRSYLYNGRTGYQ